MMGIIKKLFGARSLDYKDLIKKGAIVIDVRSKIEYAGSHIAGSINIPLDQLLTNLHKLKEKKQIIITCCASGARSQTAKRLLVDSGFLNVFNGGGWTSLRAKI
jgi:phage shock protein E